MTKKTIMVTDKDLPLSFTCRIGVWDNQEVPHAIDVTLSRLAPGVYGVTGFSEWTSKGPKLAVTNIQLLKVGG